MSTKMYLALFFAALMIVPTAVSANIFETDYALGAASIIFGPDIPDYMLYYSGTNDVSPYAVLQWLIFPFLALFVIIFGVLTEIKIFRSRPKFNGVLALLITFIAGPTGGLVWIVRNIFVVFGYYSFLIFAGLLFIGTALWGWARYRFWKPSGKTWGEAGKRMKNIMTLDETIRKYEHIYRSSGYTKKVREDAYNRWKELVEKRDREEFDK